MPVIDPQALTFNRVQALRRYHREAGVPRAQLDGSGGAGLAVLLGLPAAARIHPAVCFFRFLSCITH